MVSDTILPVMMMTDDSQNREYYNYDAWGEHYDSSSLPAVVRGTVRKPSNFRFD
jgi:hypothetical protein